MSCVFRHCCCCRKCVCSRSCRYISCARYMLSLYSLFFRPALTETERGGAGSRSSSSRRPTLFKSCSVLYTTTAVLLRLCVICKNDGFRVPPKKWYVLCRTLRDSCSVEIYQVEVKRCVPCDMIRMPFVLRFSGIIKLSKPR